MVLVRSIRRKLFLSLALVMAMLLVQAAGGLTGLWSYRAAITDLDQTLTGQPRRTELVTALAWTAEPLLWPPTAGRAGRQTRHAAFVERLQAARQAVSEFHRRLELDPGPPDARIPTEALLRRIDERLVTLRQHDVPRLLDPDEELAAVADLHQALAGLQVSALQIPRVERTAEATLDSARKAYSSRFWWITLATIAALGLFLMVMRCGYLWVFLPIKKLHEGASRVAQGDFRYRLQVSGNDEISQLAEKFNSMTARFEEIRDQLDGEVQSRTKQALRSERLAGVGFLAAGVAHEINNPLSAIAMAAESMEGRLQDAAALETGLPLDDQAVLQQYLAMIQREAFRCQQITQRLLEFARGQDAPRMRTDLTKIIREVLDMVGHLSRFRGHRIIFDDRRPVEWVVNAAEIKQVVLNMIANALEAMEGTGRLEITVQERGDEVLLCFTDNGCGMTPHVLDNLFEPFFTEKKSGRGTGLGLSISHRIVTDHGGRIVPLSDGPGRGSTFRIHLPRIAETAVQAA